MKVFDMLPDEWLDPPVFPSSPRRKEPAEFVKEGSSGRSVMFEIKKFSFFPSVPERVRDRVYAVLSDTSRVVRQRVLDERESWFRYEIMVEIEFKQASQGHQFINLIERTGASIDIV